MSEFSIRNATREDVTTIHAWLRDEKKRNIPGNFLCNWEIITESYAKSNLFVCVDATTDKPIGFRCGGLTSPSIMQVQHEYKRKGVGKELVQYCIELAKQQDECFLEVRCEPETSRHFWIAMGFTPYRSHDKRFLYAYRTLSKELDLPEAEGREPCRVRIAFYPESRLYDKAVDAVMVAEPKAVLLRDNSGVEVYLAERVAYYDGCRAANDDPVLEIQVNGKTLHLEKAKYLDMRLGIGERDRLNPNGISGIAWRSRGFVIDRFETNAVWSPLFDSEY